MGLQRVGRDWATFTFTCTRARLPASLTNSFLLRCVAVWRDSTCFCWTELNGWDGENAWTHPTCLHPDTLSTAAVALSSAQVNELRSAPNQSILGRKVGLSPSPGSPGAQRCQVHLKSVWGSPITCFYSGGEQTLGFCQHRDGVSVRKATGLALFFCHPWRALSLKWPVSFQWKSNKYLEENNPIWKSVGNSVSTFSGSA